MKRFLFNISFFICITSYAQQDTLFFDADWTVCKKAKASFYRIAELQTNGGYLIKDMYLKTNIPQMLAYSAAIEPTFKEGKCIYYYPNGNKESEGYYERNVKVGFWKNWTIDGDSTEADVAEVPKKENIIENEPWLYNPKHPFSFSVRAKVATFFIIEDVYFLTYTLGTEFTYKKHSIGIDATWFRWRYETDNSDDVGMYSQYELRTYLHVDYKCTFVSFSRPQLDIYFNAYDKIGNYSMWYDKYEEYDFKTKDMSFLLSTSKGRFNAPGLGFGIRKYFVGSRLGIDCSTNIEYRMLTTNEVNYISATAPIEYNNHVKKNQVSFYMRMNFVYKFGK